MGWQEKAVRGAAPGMESAPAVFDTIASEAPATVNPPNDRDARIPYQAD